LIIDNAIVRNSKIYRCVSHPHFGLTILYLLDTLFAV